MEKEAKRVNLDPANDQFEKLMATREIAETEHAQDEREVIEFNPVVFASAVEKLLAALDRAI